MSQGPRPQGQSEPTGGAEAQPHRPGPGFLLRLARAMRRHWMVGVGLVAVAGLILAVNPDKAGSALSTANLGLLSLMLPCVLLLYFMHGIAWWKVLQGLEAEIGFWRAVEVTITSQAFIFLPGGDLWRVPVIRAEAGRTAATGVLAGSVVYDNLIYFLVMTLAMIPAVALRPDFLVGLGALLVPLIVIIGILSWPPLYSRLARIATRIGPLKRFEDDLEDLGPTFRRLLRPRVLLPVLAADFVCVVLAVMLFYLALVSVHAGGVGFFDVAFTYAFGQVSASLTVLPAALGLYEGMMTGLMALQGAAPASAAVAALLYRLFNDLLMALVGLAVAFAADPSRRARGKSRQAAGARGAAFWGQRRRLK